MPNIKDLISRLTDTTNLPMYKVILHNDDYTPKDLVVDYYHVMKNI